MFTSSKAKKARRTPIARHPAFGAIVTLWAAALFGLGTLVVTRSLALVPVATIAGAALGWYAARFIARHAGRQMVMPAATKAELPGESEIQTEAADVEVETDEAPAEEVRLLPGFIEVGELGVSSFDEPIAPEDFPPHDELAPDGIAAQHEDEPDNEDVPKLDPAPAWETVANADVTPVEVDEPAPVAQPESAADALRSQEVAEMSLVQMIERFALALDEYRETRLPEAHNDGDGLPDPALIEALRALPVITGSPARHFAADGNAALDISTERQAEETEAALREALEKLQRMSGGA